MNPREYWSGLQPREQRVLGAGAIALALILIYVLIIDPVSSELTRLRDSVATQQEELGWMRQAAVEVKSLMGTTPRASGRSGQSAMSAIDAAARKYGLGKALKQLSPNAGKVRVRLEGAGFDAMLQWLGELSEKQGIGVDTLTMERLPDPGLVNATVVLGGGE